MSRSSLYILLFIIAVILGLFWLLFGGPSVPDRKNPEDFLTSRDEEVLLEDEATAPPRRNVPRLITPPPSTSGSNDSVSAAPSSADMGETNQDSSSANFDPYFGLDPKFMKDVQGLSKRSLEERKTRLRDKLSQQGYTHEDYIDLRVLALNEEIHSQKIQAAQEAAEASNPDQALKTLLDIESQLDPSNVLLRRKIWGYIGSIAGKAGWPDLFVEATSKTLDLEAKTLEIKLNSQLANNPDKRAELQERYDMLSSRRSEMVDMARAGMNMFEEHGGMAPELKRMRNAAAVNITNNPDQVISTREMSRGFQDLDANLEEYWKEPKSGRP